MVVNAADFARHNRLIVEAAIAHDRACHTGSPAGLRCGEAGNDGAFYVWTSGEPVPAPVKAKWDACADEWEKIFATPPRTG